MPAKVHMSKKELEDLIQVGKAAGTDTSQLEALLAEVAPEKSDVRVLVCTSCEQPALFGF